MMAFILATDFDFIAYMSKMAFFLGGGLFSRQWRFFFFFWGGGGGGDSPQCHGAAMPRGRFSNSPITQLLETSYSLKNSKLETSYSLKNKRGL